MSPVVFGAALHAAVDALTVAHASSRLSKAAALHTGGDELVEAY